MKLLLLSVGFLGLCGCGTTATVATLGRPLRLADDYHGRIWTQTAPGHWQLSANAVTIAAPVDVFPVNPTTRPR